MKDMEVRIGIISIVWGAPTPSYINDVLDHVGGEEAHFSMVNLEGSNSHYIVTDRNLLWTREDSDSIAYLALTAYFRTQELIEEGKEGIVNFNKGGIAQLDLDVYDEEYRFTSSKAPDVWVYGVWY